MNQDLDSQVRLAAFEFLERELQGDRDAIRFERLREGFWLGDEQVHLVAQSGIFKPRMLDIPLTIRTSPNGPYGDRFEDELLIYRFRGTDPNHRDNLGLRDAMRGGKPLIYLCGIGEGEYVPEWPVFIVGEGEDADGHFFRVAFPDDKQLARDAAAGADISYDGIRRYLTVETERRLHQRPFSARVRRAYENRCAICRIGHRPLLEAAHILADRHPKGDAVVTNGLLLCKLHHAAFDSDLIGIRPDRIVEVRQSVLIEPDGPMLEHGLKGFHHRELSRPRHRNELPNEEFLQERYERFRRAG